ncbi:Acyltransferase [Solimicrobium silvestre]|uniref:Acyltransferase n=1 Tax=Solimicrobium silvestre TaxID=2099400 RepID=A0A2S9H594_9BURK|nr:Acyltransferase [Solimicrobium silvestre]
MLERAFYGWRLLATGFCFAVFGIGGLFLRVLVCPLLNLLVWNRAYRTALARTMIRVAFRFFVGLMQGLGVLRYEIIGRQRLDRSGLLILANHPTLIDTVFLMAFVKRADCIVKADLQTNLFTRGAVIAAGYIFNNHGSELVNDCINSLECGSNLIVFPEGTRTPSDGQICLKRGAANIAVRAKCNVTPVVITCYPKTLSKGEKWWQIPLRPATFRIEVKDDIEIDQFTNNAVSDVMSARHLTTYLQTYFAEEIQRHA